jgi:hypothetical protein
MAGHTPAQPWMVWPGEEFHGDARPTEDQAKIAHGVWLSGRPRVGELIEAEAL